MLDKSSASVRAMFEDIAPTYDLLNHLLSARQDVLWRRRAIRRLAPRPHERILDLCCGTGDSTRELARQSRGAEVIGADFALPMLQRARAKNLPALVTADALQMPFADATFDAAMVAFGARNFEDTRSGMREMARVVKPGGRLLVLEFMRPTSLLVQRGFGAFNLALSPVGRAVSGHSSAYSYLPQSVGGFFTRREFETLLRECGWKNVRSFDHTLGVASSFLARRR
jgi:demethylmenaquinone methyltransferase/2-methoxy-6-polyprenyl-1,4-benzoquinol methylase